MLAKTLLVLFIVGLCGSAACTSGTVLNGSHAGNTNFQKSRETDTHNIEQKKPLSAESANCSKTIVGSKKVLRLPARLCFNEKLPVDKSQNLPNRRKQADDPNLYSEDDVTYDKLPLEVREVVELTAGNKYKGRKFKEYVLRDSDLVRNQAVKAYRYLPYDNDGVLELDNWTFKAQGGKMRLETVELRNTGD